MSRNFEVFLLGIILPGGTLFALDCTFSGKAPTLLQPCDPPALQHVSCRRAQFILLKMLRLHQHIHNNHSFQEKFTHEPNFIELLKQKSSQARKKQPSTKKVCLPRKKYAYQNKVTSQTTTSHVQFVTGILLNFAQQHYENQALVLNSYFSTPCKVSTPLIGQGLPQNIQRRS